MDEVSGRFLRGVLLVIFEVSQIVFALTPLLYCVPKFLISQVGHKVMFLTPCFIINRNKNQEEL